METEGRESTEAKPWDQQAGESSFWFNRFTQYRLLGPRRSIDSAHRASKPVEGLTGQTAGSHWFKAAKEWNWKERAEAWDQAEREEFVASEAARRLDARRRRLEIIEEVQEHAYKAIVAAELDRLDKYTARELLGQTRMLLADSLKAQRLEYGESTEIMQQGLLFSADDLAAAEAELEAWANEKLEKQPTENTE
jgi:hypothetical protein